MAKYSKKASDKVGQALHEQKRGQLKSGRNGQKVKSREQAIAIGLSEAREEGAKVPRKKGSAKKTAPKKTGAKKVTTKKAAAKKSPAKKTGAKKTASKKSGAGKSRK